jgi:alcohol dehydrogenase (NADP+)
MRHFELHGGGRMPALGLGTWKADPGVVGETVAEAIRVGYRHFDCAPIYGNEPEIGDALEAATGAGLVSRENLWVTSKLWNDNHLPEHVLPALKQTLSDLRLEYLDLFLVHWPIAHKHGVGLPESPDQFLAPTDAPITDTWAAMEEAVDRGLCRYIGVSNFSVRKIGSLLESARIRPAANQVESHPFLAQNELAAFCLEHGMVFTAYSPMGSKDRPDWLKHEDEPVPLEDSTILGIAGRNGISAGQVLLAWALQRGTCPIPKSSSPDRLRENFAAAGITLSEEDMALLNGLDRHYRLVDGSFFCPPGSPYTLETLWDE